jgi:hypothetical protein
LLHLCRSENAGLNKPPAPTDFLGYVIFKSDFFTGEPKPKDYVFEAVVLPSRGVKDNNFIHCSRIYLVKTTLGTFAIKEVKSAKDARAEGQMVGIFWGN